MLEPGLALLPDDTRVGFLGLVRDERTLAPRGYLESLPAGLGDDEVVVARPDDRDRRLGRGRASRRCARPGRAGCAWRA